MDTKFAKRVQKAYAEVANACNIKTARSKPWASTNDAILLKDALKDIDKDDDKILDLGCCGWPWITNFLYQEGYNVVGADIHKPHWHEHKIADNLGLPLVAYDGKRLPFDKNSFDLVLMFGVLEHIGVWKDDDKKYQKRVPETTEHRETILREVRRILSNNSILYVTKFPNTYGRDKLIGKMLGDIGHLDSERARPKYLHSLFKEKFDTHSIFLDGLLPHRVPLGSPSFHIPYVYAKSDKHLSNLPFLKQFAQNYCIIATTE
jgi:ubiquinone/menaquinone biosynthesis C-methylase UbiE